MTREIYYANSSIVYPNGKEYKSAYKVNLQFLFDDQVGTQNFQRLMFRATNRPRDYLRSIYENQEDYKWPRHNQIIEQYTDLKRSNHIKAYIGKGKLFKDNNRMEHTCCLLKYDTRYDIFDVDFYIKNWSVSLTLRPQKNKLYPWRGEFHSNIDVTAGSIPCPW